MGLTTARRRRRRGDDLDAFMARQRKRVRRHLKLVVARTELRIRRLHLGDSDEAEACGDTYPLAAGISISRGRR
jgi:hypothetical protein